MFLSRKSSALYCRVPQFVRNMLYFARAKLLWTTRRKDRARRVVAKRWSLCKWAMQGPGSDAWDAPPQNPTTVFIKVQDTRIKTGGSAGGHPPAPQVLAEETESRNGGWLSRCQRVLTCFLIGKTPCRWRDVI